MSALCAAVDIGVGLCPNMVNDGYTHWVILRVAGGALVSVAPLASLASVYVAPTVQEAVKVLGRGEVAALRGGDGGPGA